MQPKVICHIMSSVDGRLLTDHWTLPFNGKTKNELLGIYELLPAFVLSCIVIVVISLLTPPPSADVLQDFEKAKTIEC